jgi:2,4-didehydro-3-deoxy-L-rhamnonate hydrolase
MRICRFVREETEKLGFYMDSHLVSFEDAARAAGGEVVWEGCDDVLAGLSLGERYTAVQALWDWLQAHPEEGASIRIEADAVDLLAPIPDPGKILLLAGNYADHIEEEGKIALERAETFPYVFMKPRTCLNDPNADVPIPKVSTDHIDYEAELGIVIGKKAKHVSEADALEYVAGYVVINDVSDRKYKPLPERKERERDLFFDWQHGKWHDGFCPMGPCIASASALPDPHALALRLTVNGEERQSASTGSMIYSVAAVIEFITQSMTLEPGDIIATGTPGGVGMTTGRFLKPGDEVVASIEGIGALKNTMVAEG